MTNGPRNSSVIPGADTGLLVCRRRWIGSGAFTEPVDEWKFDSALMKVILDLEKQAALELGQLMGPSNNVVATVPQDVQDLAEAFSPAELGKSKRS